MPVPTMSLQHLNLERIKNFGKIPLNVSSGSVTSPAKIANSPDLFSGKKYQFTEDTTRNACGQNAER
jgi:hypothetical protein